MHRQQAARSKPLWIFHTGQLLGLGAIFIAGWFGIPVGIAILLGAVIAAASYVVYMFRSRSQN